MKINITKTLAVTLIASILVITGSLCLKSHNDVNISSDHMVATDDAISDSFSADPCYRWQPIKLLAKKLVASIQPAQRGNSLLPCCYDGNGSDTASVSRTENLGQLVPVISFVDIKPIHILSGMATYKNPTISPPELPSILATVIRT